MDNIDVHEHGNMCIAKPAMNGEELDDNFKRISYK